MITVAASERLNRQNPQLRRLLSQQSNTPRRIRKQIDFVCYLQSRVSDWTALDPEERGILSELVLSFEHSKLSVDYVKFSVLRFWDGRFHKNDVIAYKSLVQDLMRSIQTHLGDEIWRAALADEDRVDAAALGRQQIATGEVVDFM